MAEELLAVENVIEERVRVLIDNINKGVGSNLDQNTQQKLAQLVNLLPDIARLNDESLINNAEIAASSLLIDEPNILLARDIIEVIKRRVRIKTTIYGKIQFFFFPKMLQPVRHSPALLVIFGLGAVLYLALPLGLVLSEGLAGTTEEIMDIPIQLLIMVGISGGVGSIVSIMVRIQDFVPATTTEPSILFFVGFFKPIIGMAFALFIFAVLNAKIIPISIDKAAEVYFFMALSFVAGFSERFAKDIVTKVEGVAVQAIEDRHK